MPHHKLCPRNPPFSTDSSWKMYKFCLFALISNLYNPRFESKCSVTLIFSGTIVWIIYYNVKETNIHEFEQHPLERMISQSSKAEKEKNAQYCSDSRICIIIIKWNRSASGIEKMCENITPCSVTTMPLKYNFGCSMNRLIYSWPIWVLKGG